MLSQKARSLPRYMGLVARKPVFGGWGTTKGADRPARSRILISAFVLANWKVSYLELLQAKFQFSS